jgi:3-phenylpropionate/trans-cinnamate dioxygenase ferredoxin reductase subunit
VKAEVAIVGNGVAGYACAARLARHGIRPLLIGPGLPVDRPPLTKKALATGVPTLLSDDRRLVERGIDRLDGHVVDADLGGASLTTDVGEVDADTVVLATGLRYTRPSIPGIEAALVNADPAALPTIAAVLAEPRRRVVVVGAGLIGTESAATLAVAGHDVTVVDVLDRPLDRLHDPLPQLGAAALAATGARFLGGVSVTELARGESGQVTLCHLEGVLTADLVLAATGGRPFAPPGLDVEVDELPLAVDAALRVPGFERVHAVGDLVVVPHARFGPIRFPHWDMAIGTGEHAADAIAGVGGELDRLPYWWTDIGQRTLAEVGWAGAAVEWAEEDGIEVGRDRDGDPVAALVVDEPRRLREARALLGY